MTLHYLFSLYFDMYLVLFSVAWAHTKLSLISFFIHDGSSIILFDYINISEMPLFRKFPEIRKFQIERKNFRKNEIMSLDKIIDQKGGGGEVWNKGKCVKIPLLKTKMAVNPIL